MSLKFRDLVDHESRLTEIIEHAEKERDAIRLLIQGMKLRGESKETQDQSVGRASIKEVCIQRLEQLGDSRFTVNDLVGHVIVTGLKTKDDLKVLRPTVANYMKKWYDLGAVDRRNIGLKKKPVYQYWVVDIDKIE